MSDKAREHAQPPETFKKLVNQRIVNAASSPKAEPLRSSNGAELVLEAITAADDSPEMEL
jgi:hypothetical protein